MVIEHCAAPITGKPEFRLLENACDTHSHIFGPFDIYPPVRPSVYALPDAGPGAHAAYRKALGVRFGVLTQPAPYADDPSAMLHAIGMSAGSIKGVAVASAGTPEGSLEKWRQAGIVGLRFIEARDPGGSRYPGSVGLDDLARLAPIMRDLKMHAQIWGPAKVIADNLQDILRHHVPIVLDHMACPSGAAANDQSFSSILSAMQNEDIWVKLVVCRIGKGPSFDGARWYHDALVQAVPHRCVWGSDWPYVRLNPPPDAAKLLDLFHMWVPDETVRRRILIENPHQLYGFS